MDEQQKIFQELAKPNIYTLWLLRFTKPKGPTPKKPSNAQFYMQHSNYINKFTAKFKCQVEEKEIPAALQLDLQNKVTKELFDQEPGMVQESLCHENQDSHNELTATYNTVLKDAPPIDQEGQDV